MSPSQLSAIGKAKPSSLKRIFGAFVNPGGISRTVPSLPNLSKDSSFYVYSAGIEYVNGRYRMVQQHPPERQMFDKGRGMSRQLFLFQDSLKAEQLAFVCVYKNETMRHCINKMQIVTTQGSRTSNGNA
ncbi:MAG: hypothetical protein SGBAC_005536 [Bacillariaceae sp.]